MTADDFQTWILLVIAIGVAAAGERLNRINNAINAIYDIVRRMKEDMDKR